MKKVPFREDPPCIGHYGKTPHPLGKSITKHSPSTASSWRCWCWWWSDSTSVSSLDSCWWTKSSPALSNDSDWLFWPPRFSKTIETSPWPTTLWPLFWSGRKGRGFELDSDESVTYGFETSSMGFSSDCFSSFISTELPVETDKPWEIFRELASPTSVLLL